MQPCETSNRNGSPQGIDFTCLHALATTASVPASLTLTQREEIWSTAVDLYQSAIMNGHTPGKAILWIVEWLSAHIPNVAKSRGGMAFLEGVGSKARRVMRAGRIFWGGGVRFGGGTSKTHKATATGGGLVLSRASVVFLLGWQTLGGGMEDL